MATIGLLVHMYTTWYYLILQYSRHLLVYAQNAWKLLCRTNYVEKNVYYMYYTCSPIPPNWNRTRPGKNGMGKPYSKFYGEDAFVKRTLP